MASKQPGYLPLLPCSASQAGDISITPTPLLHLWLGVGRVSAPKAFRLAEMRKLGLSLAWATPGDDPAVVGPTCQIDELKLPWPMNMSFLRVWQARLAH